MNPEGRMRRFHLVTVSVVVLATLALTSCSAPPSGPPEARIIVSGASSRLGGRVVEELIALGVEPERLILVSPTPEDLERFGSVGAATRFGDPSRPETLVDAYAGGDRMLLISVDTGGGGEGAALHGNAIDAAVAAGVGHVVYTSLVDLDNDESPVANDHRATERHLRDSGLAWTMLRNAVYMDDLVSRAAEMIAEGVVTVPAQETGVAYVALGDCAAAAASVLAGVGHEFMVYDVTGPAVLRTADVAAAATAVTGVEIDVIEGEPSPPEPVPGAEFSGVVGTAVRDLTGRPATSIADLLEARRADLP